MRKGQRVELHPCTDKQLLDEDAWTQEDIFGTVVGFGQFKNLTDRWTGEKVSAIRIRLDVSGKVRTFHPDNVSEA
jgi:hypothetical protein